MSILSKVIEESMHCLTRSGFRKGSATQAKTCPFFISEVSGMWMVTRRSAESASSLEVILPPLDSYSASE